MMYLTFSCERSSAPKFIKYDDRKGITCTILGAKHLDTVSNFGQLWAQRFIFNLTKACNHNVNNFCVEFSYLMYASTKKSVAKAPTGKGYSCVRAFILKGVVSGRVITSHAILSTQHR